MLSSRGLARSFAALSICALAACRGSDHEEVTVHPRSVTLPQGGTQSFAATAAAGSELSVTWAIAEGQGGGSITSAGLYTAPMAAGQYHVSATSVADPARSGSATVTVQLPPVAISVSPPSAAVSGCRTAQFSATVVNTANTAVSWSVQEGTAGGTVDSNGLYTAPGTPGIYHVVATSQADTTRTSIATVTVATQVLAVAVSPGTPSVTVGGSVAFTATVTTTCGDFTATQVVAAK
jgi:hypothetical protein